MRERASGVRWAPRWYVTLAAGFLALALTIGFQAVSAQRGSGAPPPPADLDYLCVNGYTGVMRDVESPACQPHETLLTLPDDYPFLACANNYTGLLRYAGDDDACRSHETAVPLPPEESQTLLCLLPSTGILKHISSTTNCPAGGTIAGVVPAPESSDDSFAALINVPIDVPADSGVLANDTLINGTITAGTASANGGTVTVNPDGSFTYAPPPGFSGTDSFTYTIANSSGSAAGTVTVEVGGPVTWFVDNSAAENGDGTLASPFNTLAAVNNDGTDPDASGEIIYLFESATAYDGGIVLENDQTLVGQDVGLAAAGVTIPPFSALPPVNPSDADPTITNTAGDGVTLAAGTHVVGVTIMYTSDSCVSGANFTGDVTLDRVGMSQPGDGDPVVNLSAIDGTITLIDSWVYGKIETLYGGVGIAATDVTALEILDGSSVTGGIGLPSDSGTSGPGSAGLAGSNVAVTIDAAAVYGGHGGDTHFGFADGGPGGVAIDLASAELTITNGSVVWGGGGAEGFHNGGDGGAAIYGTDLFIAIDASSVNGGTGGNGELDGLGSSEGGGAGGPATEIEHSTLLVTGSTVTGGPGGATWEARGGIGATAISAQNSAVTIQGSSTVTGGRGGGSIHGDNGFAGPGVNVDDTDLTITASTVRVGDGSPAEIAITITSDDGTASEAVTLTNNTLQSRSAAVPSLLVQTNSDSSNICLNASGNSNGEGGAPDGPFVLDNVAGSLGITQADELTLSADNFNVEVQVDGTISFGCTQG